MIWICEKNKMLKGSLLEKICLEYPVRLISRIEDFDLAIKLKSFQNNDPIIFVIDLDTIDFSYVKIKNQLESKIKNYSVILVSKIPQKNSVVEIENELYVAKNDVIQTLRLLIPDLKTNYRPNKSNDNLIRYNDIEFSFEQMQLTYPCGNREILPLKEAQLLKLFLENPRKVISRKILSSEVWNNLKISPRTIDSHISRLRKKLTYTGIEIESIYGGGYSIK